MGKFNSAALAAVGLGLAHATAQADMTDNVVKIGVLSDMSSLYTDLSGQGSVVAAQMAVDRVSGHLAVVGPGFRVEVPRGSVHSATVKGDEPVVSLDAIKI